MVTVRLQRSESGVQKSEFKAFKWCTLEEALNHLTLDETKQIMREGDKRLKAYLEATGASGSNVVPMVTGNPSGADVVLHTP